MSVIKYQTIFIFLCAIFFILHSPVTATETIHLPFHKTTEFLGKSQEYSINQTDPPVYIEYQVSPLYEDYTKEICKNADCSHSETIHATRISPKSWFLITVTRSGTSETIEEDGFGKQFDQNIARKKLSIRNPGPYTISMYGNFVTVDYRFFSPGSDSPANPEPTATRPPVTISRTIPLTQTTIVNSPTTISGERAGKSESSGPEKLVLVVIVLSTGIFLLSGLIFDGYYKNKGRNSK